MERLISWQDAFAYQTTKLIVLTIAGLLLLTPIIYLLLSLFGKLSAGRKRELWLRWASWVVIAVLLIAPILLGPLTTMIGVALLGFFCFREYAAVTGLDRDHLLSGTVVLGIVFLTLATIDNWYMLFVALMPLTTAVIGAVGILRDQPDGYIKRVALAVFGYVFFGVSFGHIGYIANEPNFRSIILLIFVTVSLNDVFAYICGKTFGHRKLIPNTSPNKTVGGALGAIVLTTTLVVILGRYVFAGTILQQVTLLLPMGLIISVVGMLGDLLISSIKRDLGIKDTGHVLPGHGGLLDRFDSLILVAPTVYHFVNYYIDVGESLPVRILSSGG